MFRFVKNTISCIRDVLTIKRTLNEYFTTHQERLNSIHSMIGQKNKLEKRYLENLSNALIAEKVEQLTKDKNSEEEKCIAIAQWIAGNISNLSLITEADSYQEIAFIAYAKRQGACADRAVLFIHMLNIIGIHGKLFNIFNHPNSNNGHTCAQVFYNNNWHFFDVTYAGYFKKNNHVIGWEEICAESHNQNHMQYMVVFERTCDLNKVPLPLTPINSQVGFIDNHQRMHDFYINICQARESSGFFREDTKKLFIHYDAETLKHTPWSIGNEQWTDYTMLTAEGVKISLSCGLGSIGNVDDSFQYIWQFTNLIPGAKYILSFSYYNEFPQGFRFFAHAIGDGTCILDGTEANSTQRVWAITFTSSSATASIEISYEAENNAMIDGLLLNKISIEKMPQ